MVNRDLLRSVVRKIMPKALYILFAHAVDILTVFKKEGWGALLKLYNADRREQIRTVYLRTIRNKIAFRPGTKDSSAIIQNILRKEYGFIKPDLPVLNVVDAGCYIGDSTIFFLNEFPACKVFALEPNNENYELAEQNLDCYKSRVSLYKNALWSSDESLNISGAFTGARVSTKDAKNGVLTGMTVESIMKMNDVKTIDILKMDIEGAEEKVLKVNNSWIESVRMFIIEFHGVEMKKECTQLICSKGYEALSYRSLIYFVKKTPSGNV